MASDVKPGAVSMSKYAVVISSVPPVFANVKVGWFVSTPSPERPAGPKAVGAVHRATSAAPSSSRASIPASLPPLPGPDPSEPPHAAASVTHKTAIGVSHPQAAPLFVPPLAYRALRGRSKTALSGNRWSRRPDG